MSRIAAALSGFVLLLSAANGAPMTVESADGAKLAVYIGVPEQGPLKPDTYRY